MRAFDDIENKPLRKSKRRKPKMKVSGKSVFVVAKKIKGSIDNHNQI